MTFIILRTNDDGGTNSIHRLYAMAGIFDTVATASKDFLVAGGVQISEPFGELHFLTIDGNGTVGWLLAFDELWQIIGINGEKPAHASVLIFQIASGFIV